MADAVNQRKTGCTRAGGIVLGRPGIGHRHPQVEAKESDNGTDSGKRKVAGRKHCDQNGTNDRKYGGDRQPQLALQTFTKEVSEDSGSDETKGAEGRYHASLSSYCRRCYRRWQVCWRGYNACQQGSEPLGNGINRDIPQEPDQEQQHGARQVEAIAENFRVWDSSCARLNGDFGSRGREIGYLPACTFLHSTDDCVGFVDAPT